MKNSLIMLLYCPVILLSCALIDISELGRIEVSGILSDVSRDTAVDINNLSIDKVRSGRSKEYCKTHKVLCSAPSLSGCLGTDESVERMH